MKVSRAKGLANFEKLNDELREAEAKSFGTKLPSGLEQHREQLVDAIAHRRTSNIGIGLLAASYRDHYKIEHEWMPIGLSIAHSLGYKSYTSLHSLMKAARNAFRVPQGLLAAVIELGIDPTENKYRKLVKDLFGMVFAGGDEEARVAAQVAIDGFHSRRQDAARKRKENSSASAAQFGDRIARQVAIDVQNTPAEERRARAELIVRQIEESIRTEMPDWSLRVTWVKSTQEDRCADPMQVFGSDAQTAASSESAPQAEVIPIKTEVPDHDAPSAPNPPLAVAAADQQPNMPGASPHRKRAVRSVDRNQLDLWLEGPAPEADQPVVNGASSVA